MLHAKPGCFVTEFDGFGCLGRGRLLLECTVKHARYAQLVKITVMVYIYGSPFA
jgi:hypothetical protein